MEYFLLSILRAIAACNFHREPQGTLQSATRRETKRFLVDIHITMILYIICYNDSLADKRLIDVM